MPESEAGPIVATRDPVQDDRDRVLQSAIEYVISGRQAPDVEQIGDLLLPKQSAEATRCRAIGDIISDYSGRAISRPMSFAVFGPPGSGKSFCVREIVKAAGCKYPFLINLSQLSSPKELAENVKGYLYPENGTSPRRGVSVPTGDGVTEAEKVEASKTMVFFFDEFDAALAGESLGWIRWFLSPMQDGKFYLGQDVIEVGKAIFMFAGGTAVSLAEFEKRAFEDPDEYRNKKVPDFISRLRGYVNIEGVDGVDNESIVRRALVLHRKLDERWPDARRTHVGAFPIDRTMTENLLSNIHFVHGVRSIEALLDMSFLDMKRSDATVQLPEDALVKLHLSRGSLDGTIIGISAGQEERDASTLLRNLAERLLQHGATLAYGGDFVPEGTLSMVIRAAEKVPDKLIIRHDKRIRNYLAYPSFYRDSVKQQLERDDPKVAKRHVDFIQLHTLSDSEMKAFAVPREQWFSARDEANPEKYNPNHHLAWAISLFRMRARLAQDISALILVGGKDDGNSWGRFSGIAEEAMLALALGKPIYVLGGRAGGAYAVGQLLGLGPTVCNPNKCLVDDEVGASLSTRDFTLPGFPDLPETTSQLRSFLFERGITTRAWPRNGLLPDENRRLFMTPIAVDETVDSSRCVNQIIAGLLRLDWRTLGRSDLLDSSIL